MVVLEEVGGATIASIHLAISTVSENTGNGLCEKIFDTAAEIAGKIEGIPEAGYKVGSILCDLVTKPPPPA
jgi:hypothetical protein